MPLRTRLFIILSIIVAVILAISIFLVISSRKAKEKKSQTATSTTQNTGANQVNRLPAQTTNDFSNSVTSGQVTIAKPTSEEIDKNAAKAVAKVFAERFGSFSNQNGYQNIKEVEDITTDALYSGLSSYMSTKQDESKYYGITTKVISSSIKSWGSSNSTLLLGSLRAEIKDGTTTQKNQDMEVTLTKSGSSWLVSSYTWK